MGFGEHQVGLGCFWCGSMAFGFFFRFGGDPVLVWGVFDVFWGLRCVLVGFLLVIMVKKDGVLPEYNIRTDRWDIALDAMNKMEMARKARKEIEIKPEEVS